MTEIDWNELVEGYGRMYGFLFKDPEDMIVSLYRKEKSLRIVSDTLGVSAQTLSNFLKKRGHVLNLPGRGYKRESRYKDSFLAIPFKEMEKMTNKEIRDITGIETANSVSKLAIRYGRNYLRKKRLSRENDSFLAIPSEKMIEMTNGEIREELGLEKKEAYLIVQLAKRHGRKYLRGRWPFGKRLKVV